MSETMSTATEERGGLLIEGTSFPNHTNARKEPRMATKSAGTLKKAGMTGNEKVARELYQAAEVKDVKRFVSLFTDDGVFDDVSAGVKYRGKELGP